MSFLAKAALLGGVVKKQAGNRFLAYRTKQSVRLHDWRLGVLFNALQLGVFLYILIHPILLQKRYVLREIPTGSLQLSLKAPQSLGRRPPPTPNQLPYCLLPNQTTYRGNQNYPCQYWTEELTLFPALEQTAMLVSTRINVTRKVLLTDGIYTPIIDANGTAQNPPHNCDLSQYNCYYTPIEETASTFYIALVDEFTIKLSHAWEAVNLGKSGDATDLSGKLYDTYGDEVEAGPNEVIGVEGSDGDIIKVGTFVRASGLGDLDEPVERETSTLSARYDGTVIVVTIDYTNLYSYDLGSYRYSYTVDLVSVTEFKTTQEVYSKDVSSIEEIGRHGVRLIFIQSGEIGVFDFQSLLLTLVSGMGLMAVAVLIVDILGGLCWRDMTEEAYFGDDEDEIEEMKKVEESKVKHFLKFLKYPFMRPQQGKRVFPWRRDTGDSGYENSQSLPNSTDGL
jgi:hypothetical protein